MLPHMCPSDHMTSVIQSRVRNATHTGVRFLGAEEQGVEGWGKGSKREFAGELRLKNLYWMLSSQALGIIRIGQRLIPSMSG